MRSLLDLLWLGLGLFGPPEIGAAAGAPFELRWDAPATCPDATAVRAAVERRLGRAIAGELGADLVIDVHASTQEGGRWRVELGMHGPDGDARRELSDASDCAAAVEAAALVIAIAIDPELAGVVPDAPPPTEEATGEVGSEQGGTPTTTSERDAATEDDRATTTSPSRAGDRTSPSATRRPTRAAIGATAAASIGELPVVGGHGRLFAAVLRPRVRIELGGSFGGAPPMHPVIGTTVGMWRWTIDARACAVIAPRRWLEILPCAGIEGGQTIVRSQGLTKNGTNDPWLALFAAPTIAFVPVRWLAIRVGPELRVPLLPREYTIQQPVRDKRVYQTRPVAGALVAGVEFRPQARRAVRTNP
jgi:hypothetical protein